MTTKFSLSNAEAFEHLCVLVAAQADALEKVGRLVTTNVVGGAQTNDALDDAKDARNFVLARLSGAGLFPSEIDGIGRVSPPARLWKLIRHWVKNRQSRLDEALTVKLPE